MTNDILAVGYNLNFMAKTESININIKTTKEFLESSETTLDKVKEDANFLLSIFQKKYLDLFPDEILSNDINRIQRTANTLQRIKSFEGFDRHIKEYNKANMNAHLFTAQVAYYLSQNGYKITLEPLMEDNTGPHPDLRLEKKQVISYAECKTSNITNYYGENAKQQIADLVYDKVPTCDQIDLFFKEAINMNNFKKLIEDQNLIKTILMTYKPNKDGQENRIKVNESLEINIIQKPAIIGSEEDFMEVTVSGFMEDIASNTRSIGLTFMKGGRSIGVYEVVDYNNKLKDKMEQSSKQMVPNFPNVVFLRDSDIVGDPEKHKEFINTYWLNSDLKNCSGIAFFGIYQDSSKNEKYKFSYYKNSEAEIDFEI